MRRWWQQLSGRNESEAHMTIHFARPKIFPDPPLVPPAAARARLLMMEKGIHDYSEHALGPRRGRFLGGSCGGEWRDDREWIWPPG